MQVGTEAGPPSPLKLTAGGESSHREALLTVATEEQPLGLPAPPTPPARTRRGTAKGPRTGQAEEGSIV
jgi:hypothetical protein